MHGGREVQSAALESDDEQQQAHEVHRFDPRQDKENEYGTYPLLRIKTDQGEFIAVHAFHTVLKNAIAREGVKAGDRIGIEFLGEVKGANGSTYNGYTVAVDRAE